MILLLLWAMVQDPEQGELKKRYDEKIGREWLKKADWILDFDRARAQARQSDRPIFAYFTRSYVR